MTLVGVILQKTPFDQSVVRVVTGSRRLRIIPAFLYPLRLCYRGHWLKVKNCVGKRFRSLSKRKGIVYASCWKCRNRLNRVWNLPLSAKSSEASLNKYDYPQYSGS
ncbi:hypothetical protein RF11_03137 [Thelohanellus kitauei]|uniref:Uncharacterized protein n=1 Tax=Thelohanellus kitauei TaxID=669202 RepID=A0A0C2NFC7_THEKT|nr:hypothetical protein RF11_03137 [Thelohanellus kitauei]